MLTDFPPTLAELDRLYKQLRAAYGEVAPLLANVFQLKRSDQRFGRRTKLAAQIFIRHVAERMAETEHVPMSQQEQMKNEEQWLSAARASFVAAQAFDSIEVDEYTKQIEEEIDGKNNDPKDVN